VHLLARHEGRVIGTQSVGAKDFAVVREVETGSWLGRRYQGQGLGTEMRAAVLMFAFDHLGATAARSGAFADNKASHGVSRKLGYVEDGTTVYARRGKPATNVRLVVRPDTFVRPDWKLEVTGLEPVRFLFGV
jgi:RimJ/RimL family protein N-acetyltransferase